MVKRTKTLAFGITAALVPNCAPSSWAQATGTLPFGGELRGGMQFSGKVVCVGCTVDEVHRKQRRKY